MRLYEVTQTDHKIAREPKALNRLLNGTLGHSAFPLVLNVAPIYRRPLRPGHFDQLGFEPVMLKSRPHFRLSVIVLKTSNKPQKIIFPIFVLCRFFFRKVEEPQQQKIFFQPMMKKKEKIFSFSHFRSNSEISLQPSQVVSLATFSLQCSASTFLIYLLQPQFRLQAFKRASNICWERRFPLQD